MRISSSRLIVTAKMPPWAQWMLRKANVPEEFKLEELDEEQKETISLIVNIQRMVEEGVLTVEFTDEDAGPTLALTGKGIEELKKEMSMRPA
ncbi:hypothetical protein B6U84_06535 [Candidatus Bathyarchaeota archaeon ex4484_40]|nr:MAG: hypothetical protein B6U84_06535 [Candidatus Bathyarchaeota archaeon ex4484_40]